MATSTLLIYLLSLAVGELVRNFSTSLLALGATKFVEIADNMPFFYAIFSDFALFLYPKLQFK